MKLMNPHGDYHLHSSSFSDGLNSIDELAAAAGNLNYTEIAITDHNQVYMDCFQFKARSHYQILTSGRWQNIHNRVNIRFGVEADLLNADGDICHHIQHIVPGFVVLSAHRKVYAGDARLIKDAYLHAIRRFGPDIQVLGHLCASQFSEYLSPADIREIVCAANQAHISLELNCANLINGKTDVENLTALLSCADTLYVNSDAHTLHEFIHARQHGFAFLENHHIQIN